MRAVSQKGCALKWNGVKALAMVRILPLKDRMVREHDVEILVNADAWKKMNDEERDALIDHELQHLELVMVKEGGKKKGGRLIVEKDDLDRPRLKMRRHDFQVGWFDSSPGVAAPRARRASRRNGSSTQAAKSTCLVFCRSR